MKQWLIGCVLCCLSINYAFAFDSYPPIALVELFTSESTADCVKADLIFSKLALANRNHNIRIYPLSFHVDLGKNSGWRDPLSQKDFNARQDWYASQLRITKTIPQLIVNGQRDVMIDGKEVQSVVNKSLRESSTVSIKLQLIKVDSKKILASFNLAGDWKGKRLAVALIERSVTVDVTRGENAHRRLKHVNVVRQFQVLAPDQASGSFIFTSPPLIKLEGYSIIAYMQDLDIPSVLGAMQLDLPALNN